MTSLKGHRRSQLMSGRKTNGKNRSMWMTYSPKMDDDLVLLGDLELIHWASELEPNPNILSFRFDEDISVDWRLDGSDEFEVLRVIWVECAGDVIELHQIDASEQFETNPQILPVRFKGADHATHQAQLVRISAARLKLNSKQLSFWLKVIAFVSQVRDCDLDYEAALVVSMVALEGEGTIRSLLSVLPIPDPAIALGIICKGILSGSIQAKADAKGFGYNTPWRSP
jgi:hypothetical protein